VSAIVTIPALQSFLAEGQPGLLIDVRSASEFATGHIPGAIPMPLEQVESRVDDLDANLPIILICKSGQRARMAAALLEPCRPQVKVLEGGTDAWRSAGYPIVVSCNTRWSLERQVRLGAGLLALIGALLAVLVSVRWAYLAVFIGLGLTFAGLTDFCPMGMLLSKMPWNGPRRGDVTCGTDRPSCCG
jgi:rhodanese-related sulfurtransferase